MFAAGDDDGGGGGGGDVAVVGGDGGAAVDVDARSDGFPAGHDSVFDCLCYWPQS